MKTILWLTSVFILLLPIRNAEKIESKVYSFSKAEVVKNTNGEKRPLMKGETSHLENFEIHSTTLLPGKAPHGSQVHADGEEIIFVKEGKIKVTIEGISKVLDPGSVVLNMPFDEHGIENAGDNEATYYIIKYKSKVAMDTDRGKLAGGSQFFDWNTIAFQPHDKGGIRRYFDRKSAMSERIEMHVTTLNPAIKSHEPHTHGPAEIVIMMNGTTEMEIGNHKYQGETGDIYFLGSNIPHAIRNTGEKACMYLAFQWE